MVKRLSSNWTSFKCFYYKKAAVLSNFCLIGKIHHNFLVPIMNELGCKTFMPFQTLDLNSVRKRKLLINDCYNTVSGHFFAICIFFFHKTEVQTVILRCWMGLDLNWFKSYGLKCNLMPSGLLANSRKNSKL